METTSAHSNLHSISHAVTDESGEITEVVGTVMDVTEQWNARTALDKAGVNFSSQLVVSRFGSIGFNIRMPSELPSEYHVRWKDACKLLTGRRRCTAEV